MSKREYLSSLPERTVRAGAALFGGIVNETTAVLLPPAIRQSRLYQSTVARLLRLVIELLGDVKGVYPSEDISAKELLVRKTAGNAVELASFLAVGWSPVWLLAAASDVSGGTKIYLQALATELKRVGFLAPETDVVSFESLLTTLENTSGVLSDAVDLPPLNIADVRTAWQELQHSAADLPTPYQLATIFTSLQTAAQHEGRSLSEISSVVGLGAVRAGIQIGHTYLFEYYREALSMIAQEGLVKYLRRVSRPYIAGVVHHFDPKTDTLTQRMVRRGQHLKQRLTTLRNAWLLKHPKKERKTRNVKRDNA